MNKTVKLNSYNSSIKECTKNLIKYKKINLVVTILLFLCTCFNWSQMLENGNIINFLITMFVTVVFLNSLYDQFVICNGIDDLTKLDNKLQTHIKGNESNDKV